MTNAWQHAADMADKHANSNGIFVRLTGDGDKIVGAFCGEPLPRASLAPQIRRWTLIRSVWICDKIRQRVIVPRGGMNRL